MIEFLEKRRWYKSAIKKFCCIKKRIQHPVWSESLLVTSRFFMGVFIKFHERLRNIFACLTFYKSLAGPGGEGDGFNMLTRFKSTYKTRTSSKTVFPRTTISERLLDTAAEDCMSAHSKKQLSRVFRRREFNFRTSIIPASLNKTLLPDEIFTVCLHATS